MQRRLPSAVGLCLILATCPALAINPNEAPGFPTNATMMAAKP